MTTKTVVKRYADRREVELLGVKGNCGARSAVLDCGNLRW